MSSPDMGMAVHRPGGREALKEGGMGTFWTTIRSPAARFPAALTVVFLLFGPYLANLTVDHNRQVYMWGRRDSLVLSALMVLTALVCVLVGALIRRIGHRLVVRVFEQFLILGLGAGLLANLWFLTRRPVGYHIGQFGMEMRTAWVLLGVLIGYSLARSDSRCVPWCRRLCLAMSPAVVIVMVQLFSASTYPPVMDEFERTVPGTTAGLSDSGRRVSPVYLFLFDEWSYERTYAEGQVRPDLPNLAALCGRSIVFHDAHSPGPETTRSIPRLLFETNLPVVSCGGRFGFEKDGAFVPSRELPSIFARNCGQGYRSIVIGFCLPFGKWLEGQVDVCRAYPWFDTRGGLINGIGVHTLRAMKSWTDPWSSFVYRKVEPTMHYNQMIRRYQAMRRDVFEVVSRQPRNTFAVCHYPLPHNPYCFDDSGNLVGPADIVYEYGDAAGYERNLRALDRLIGELTAAMEQTGTFDDALLVLTSDHSFRYEPDLKAGDDERLTHVPLVVKPPGQQEGVRVDSRFETWHVGSLIDSVLRSGGKIERVEELLDAGEAGRVVMDTAGATPAGGDRPRQGG